MLETYFPLGAVAGYAAIVAFISLIYGTASAIDSGCSWKVRPAESRQCMIHVNVALVILAVAVLVLIACLVIWLVA